MDIHVLAINHLKVGFAVAVDIGYAQARVLGHGERDVMVHKRDCPGIYAWLADAQNLQAVAPQEVAEVELSRGVGGKGGRLSAVSRKMDCLEPDAVSLGVGLNVSDLIDAVAFQIDGEELFLGDLLARYGT